MKKNTKDDERLQEWNQVVTSAGYFCEVRSLVSDLSPFPESLVEKGPVAHEPRCALFIYHSRHLMFDSSTGPFQARGGTPLYGLYGDVPLDRVWFLASLS